MTLLAHLSDLHFGAELPRVVAALLEDLADQRPALAVISGDLTQRARPDQFRAARQFLERLPCPRLAVPGNHDMPLFDVASRLLWPLRRYRRYIAQDVDPLVVMDDVAVLGLNSARATTLKNGRLSLAQIARVRSSLGPLPARVVKVLVTHHPFVPPPGDPGPRIVGRAREALQAAEAAGVDLLLAGHLHRGYTGDIRAHHADIRRAILVAQAGTATSHRLRDEANSYNLLELSPQRLRFSVRVWDGLRFQDGGSTEYVKTGLEWERPGGRS